MPYIVRPRGLPRIATTILAGLLCALAVPATAGAACASGATSTPFAQFGDESAYTLLAGGSFESGAPGWWLANARVVAGNESYEVIGGSYSLEIGPGGVATSPRFCVGAEEPTFRFFYRRTAGAYVTSTVALDWTDSSGFKHETPVDVGHPEAAWAPTPLIGLSDALPPAEVLGTVSARLVFRSGPEGASAIDDIFIDPYRR